METKCIKNIEEETWKEFKTLAIKYNLNMGELLKRMIIKFNNNDKDLWNNILNRKKILSEKEAEDIEKITRKIRKERGFRDEINF